MIKRLLLLLGIFSWCTSKSQHLEFVCKDTGFGYGVVLDFYDGYTDGLEIDTFTWEGGNAGACPTAYTPEGKVIAWFNGRAIYDGIDREAINGDEMERGDCWRYITSEWDIGDDEGTNIQNTALIVPATDSLFLLFHHTSEFFVHDSTELFMYNEDGRFIPYSDGLYMTTMRLRYDGRIEILEDQKAVKIVEDYLKTSSLAACRNADNTGWWVTTAKSEDKDGYLLEVGKDGLINIKEQSLSDNHVGYVPCIRTVFNHDGTRMARLLYGWSEGQLQYIEVYSFDRCDGSWELLETIGGIEIDYFKTGPFSDIEFSPDGRFLYWARRGELIQYDISGEIGQFYTTIDTVALYEEVEDSSPPYFSDLMTLPNGKIVIGSTVSTGILHIIHKPNERGAACDVEQSAYLMPMYPDSSKRMRVIYLPSPVPIYMEPLDANCITNTIPESIGKKDYVVYPNPTSGMVQVAIAADEVDCPTYSVYDLKSILLMNKTTCEGKLDLSSLPAGVYFIHKNGSTNYSKVIKY